MPTQRTACATRAEKPASCRLCAPVRHWESPHGVIGHWARETPAESRTGPLCLCPHPRRGAHGASRADRIETRDQDRRTSHGSYTLGLCLQEGECHGVMPVRISLLSPWWAVTPPSSALARERVTASGAWGAACATPVAPARGAKWMIIWPRMAFTRCTHRCLPPHPKVLTRRRRTGPLPRSPLRARRVAHEAMSEGITRSRSAISSSQHCCARGSTVTLIGHPCPMPHASCDPPTCVRGGSSTRDRCA